MAKWFLDYVYDVHMDISHQFFPLPSVVIPNIMIKRPSVTEYSFESERKAIADYEKNKGALAIKVKEMKTKNVASEKQSDIIVDRMLDVACELHIRKVHSGVILEPSRVIATTSQQQNTKPVKPALNAFEEFELKPNLFDLLELSTIDDKAALEQILANAPPPVSSSVVGSSAQSSSGLLSSSSVPNMGVKVSETSDSNGLYNLPTTFKSYKSSFGIGVPSASFRQNL
uniref:Protein suppressor of variegation 3-7 n=1 Tax=Elaeophora elaphi TaxID=1147741 RepID=A0A0R3RX44_9BILA